MFKTRYLLLLSVLFYASLSHGQSFEKENVLDLSELKDFNTYSHIAAINGLGYKNIWGTSNSIDSILWEIPLKSNSGAGQCVSVPGSILVLEKKIEDTIYLGVLKKYNPFLKKEIIQVFNYDSLFKWKIDSVNNNIIPKQYINIPQCINNKVEFLNIPFFFIPLKLNTIHYNDDRLNSFPCLSVISADIQKASFGNNEIFVNTTGIFKDQNPTISIQTDGVLQRNEIKSGLKYKKFYALHDTISIQSKSYLIDSISKGSTKLYFHEAERRNGINLPDSIFSEFLPYFKKDFLVVDFWGTWCGPCVEKLPELRQLYEVYGNQNISFLSICYDDPGNFPKAKELFKSNNIGWPQIFDNFNKRIYSISGLLHVSAFPTYMVISKNGEIILSDFGTEGFERLSSQLTDLSKVD